MHPVARIKQRLYYSLTPLLAGERTVSGHPFPADRKGVILYFDYEREFGGGPPIEGDAHIHRILDILRDHGVNSTWFTVGMVLQHYPASVEAVLAEGHELASHSYGHIMPYRSSKRSVVSDFNAFRTTASPFAGVKGYHAPNGRWSLSSLREMARHAYSYDMVSCRHNSCHSPVSVHSSGLSMLRFRTLGDDWPLHRGEAGRGECIAHYEAMLDRLAPGQVYGLGFHPWLLAGNGNIMSAFEWLAETLAGRQDIVTDTAASFAAQIHRK